MLTVHHLGLSQSERIVWLCEELGMDYELKRYQRRADNGHAPDDYKALYPMGIAPVVTDGDLVLGESAAICEYIAIKHGGGRLIPAADSPDYAGHLFWYHFSNGTFMANSMMEVACLRAGAAPAEFVADRKARAWQLADQRLAVAPFFGGSELTLADIMMGFALTTMRALVDYPIDDYPNILAYLQRIGSRPAYRRAMAKAEPDMPPKLG